VINSFHKESKFFCSSSHNINYLLFCFNYFSKFQLSISLIAYILFIFWSIINSHFLNYYNLGLSTRTPSCQINNIFLYVSFIFPPISSYLNFMMNIFQIRIFSLIWAIVASLGGGILGVYCCRATDIKIIIAYSSVVHISLIIVSLLLLRKVGLMGAWWVIIAHGVVSSGIFTIANLLYERSHSRRMLVNKGYSRSGPSFTIFWFIIIIINFAGPFTLNLLGEIYLIIRVVSISNFIIIPVALLSFFSAAYSLLLFTSTQHGVPQSCNILSISPDKRELNLIFGHIWPVILILLRLGI